MMAPQRLEALRLRGQLALLYDGACPNGSMGDVAGLCDESGHVLGLMPHPERAILFHQRDDWPRVAARIRSADREGELPRDADGKRVFAAAVRYFS